MDTYSSYNAAYADGSRTPGRATTIRLGNARRPYGSASAEPASTQQPYTARPSFAGQPAARPQRGSRRDPERPSAARFSANGASAGAAAVAVARPAVFSQRAPRKAASKSERRASNFMHYANDNRVVNAVYEFVAGSTKPLFIALVAIAVGVSLYFPVRDLYVAKRSSDILAQQVEIRKSYNDALQKDVDKLLSEDGIKDVATDKLGLVMPGEKKIDVVGLDDEGGSTADDSSQIKKSTEVEKAEQKVAEDAPWYIKALDTFFGFAGVEGQTVASSGN